MRQLVFLSLGMLLCAGCADTAEEYKVNKPVITEPVPNAPVQPEIIDTDLDGNLDVDDNDAIEDSSSNRTPGAADTDPATSGTPETDATSDEVDPQVP